MEKPHIPIFFSSDHNYIMPTCVAIHSMLEHSKDCDCIIYILIDDSVTSKDKDILTNTILPFNADLNFIEVEPKMRKGYAFRGISKACYYRLFIPWLIPNLKTAIYCDGDVIFMQSIRLLYNQSCEDNFIAAVHTPYYDTDDFVKYAESLNLNSSEYVNSGILILNCEKMREMELMDVLMSHLCKNYYYQDQDIINIVCKGHIEYLSLEFNYPSYLFITKDFRPAIIHYSGPKPWKVFTNLWAYWWSVYARSIVYDSVFEAEMYRSLVVPHYSFKQVIRLFFRCLKRKCK